MKTLHFEVQKQRIGMPRCAELVAGSAEIYEAAFAFDESWDGFARTAVFECAGERREQLLVNDRCIVPWEMLYADAYLRVGVYGVSGDAAMPTVYSGSMYVACGAEPSEEAREHSADMFDQIAEIGQQVAGDAEAVAETKEQWESMSAEAETLSAGSEATASYSGGVLRLGIPGSGASSWNDLAGKPFESIGENLKVVGGALAVDTAPNVQQDNTKPITSAAVYTEVGNIHALLALI